MERYLHFTDNYNTFEPTSDPDVAPAISLEYGGLFVYRFPDDAEDFNTLWKAWGYRDAVEIFANPDCVFYNSDALAEDGGLWAEYIIPFSELENICYSRVDC